MTYREGRSHEKPVTGVPRQRSHRYAYDFDSVLRKYLLRTLEAYLQRDGATLELDCYKGNMTARYWIVPVGYGHRGRRRSRKIVQERFPGQVTVITSSLEDTQIESKSDNICSCVPLNTWTVPSACWSGCADSLTPTGHLFVRCRTPTRFTPDRREDEFRSIQRDRQPAEARVTAAPLHGRAAFPLACGRISDP